MRPKNRHYKDHQSSQKSNEDLTLFRIDLLMANVLQERCEVGPVFLGKDPNL